MITIYSSDDDYRLMVGHYCFYIAGVNEWVSFYISAVFARYNGISMVENSDHKFDIAPALLMTWLCTKYQCYFPLELLVYSSAKIIMPLSQFYNLMIKGWYHVVVMWSDLS